MSNSKINMKKHFTILLIVLPFLAFAGDEKFWPKEIPAGKGGIITLYQPTLEDLEGVLLKGRSAVSYKKSEKDEPVFGVIWFTATLETDKNNRMATLQKFDITNSKFSADASQAQLDEFARIVEEEVVKWEIDLSIDQITTSLESNKNLNDPYLKNDPPVIDRKSNV